MSHGTTLFLPRSRAQCFHTCGWVNESCPTYERVMACVCVQMDQGVMAWPHLRHTYESISHVTYLNKSWPTNGMSHVPCVKMSWYDLIFGRWIPRVEWRGLTTFAERNKACIFRKLFQAILSWNLSFLQNILELGLSPKTPTQIDWLLKIRNIFCVCIKFPPPVLSPLHSTRKMSHVTHVNKSCPSNETSHTLKNHGTTSSIGFSHEPKTFPRFDTHQQANESCHTCEQVMSHEWNESRPIHKGVVLRSHLWSLLQRMQSVMSHIWRSHGTTSSLAYRCVNKPSHTNEPSHVPYIRES